MENWVTKTENRTNPGWLVLAWLATFMLLWLLAFLHVPGDSAQWLTRLQLACFGSNPSGLPDAGGWILLTLAPALMLVGLIVTFGPPLHSGLRALIQQPGTRALVFFVLALMAAEVIWIGLRLNHALARSNTNFQAIANGELPLEYPVQDWQAPEFILIDQTGRQVSLDSFKGQKILLTFAFAHCTTVCPVIVHNIRQALSAKKDALTAPVVGLVITLDPYRDTPSTLSHLAKTWDLPGPAHVLSGPPVEVEKVLDSYNIPRQRSATDGDVVHPAMVLVLNSTGRVKYIFNNPPTAWLIQALSRVD